MRSCSENSSERISKMHLTPKGFVKNRFEILKYYRVCSYTRISNRFCAAPLDVIYYF